MFLIPFSDKSPVNSGGQPCKKHELYVSFSDLGWKVSAQLLQLSTYNYEGIQKKLMRTNSPFVAFVLIHHIMDKIIQVFFLQEFEGRKKMSSQSEKRFSQTNLIIIFLFFFYQTLEINLEMCRLTQGKLRQTILQDLALSFCIYSPSILNHPGPASEMHNQIMSLPLSCFTVCLQ